MSAQPWPQLHTLEEARARLSDLEQQDGWGERWQARPLSSVGIWKTVQVYVTQLGLANLKPHDFRHFVGTQLARVNIRQAQQALGHKSIETTARHYDLNELEVGLTDKLY